MAEGFNFCKTHSKEMHQIDIQNLTSSRLKHKVKLVKLCTQIYIFEPENHEFKTLLIVFAKIPHP